MYQCNECFANCDPSSKRLASSKFCKEAKTRRTIKLKFLISNVRVAPNPSLKQQQVIKWFLKHN